MNELLQHAKSNHAKTKTTKAHCAEIGEKIRRAFLKQQIQDYKHSIDFILHKYNKNSFSRKFLDKYIPYTSISHM